jgi:FkbH-like protein
MKIELVSNINMDSIQFYIKDYQIINSCDFGSHMIGLLDKDSELHKSKSDIVLLFLDFDELNESIDDVISAVDVFINDTGKTVIMNTLAFSPKYIDTFLNTKLELELNANLKLVNFSNKNQNVLLLDFSKLLKQSNFIDEKYWYMARIKFSRDGFKSIARELKLLIDTYLYGSKKVLVLDMDNTLWGGVIGEEEIKLSNDGVGKIYLDFQKKIKQLKELGILLAVCSKNNYDDGIKGLNHINSILKESDFIIKKINWNDKASNIKEILEELNLGNDSLVFLDDNPVEREYVKKILPNIIVPDFPEDVYSINSWFLDVVEDFFSKVSLTTEDLKKQEQYLAKKEREVSFESGSYKDFLKTLNIEIDFYINDGGYVERYAQMTQKTNQFNLTTKRYTVVDIQEFIDDPSCDVIAINYRDKFANEGITGLVIVNVVGNYVEIDSFLLSCRILKRGMEDAIFCKLEELYFNKDIVGIYTQTKRNEQTKGLYTSYGFKEIDKNKFIKKVKQS